MTREIIPSAQLRRRRRKPRIRQERKPQKSRVGTDAGVGVPDAGDKNRGALLTSWLFEPKWDGYRAVCFLRDGAVRFTSRNQRDLTKRFPELQTIGKSIKASKAILDGEIVALDRNGSQCFEQLQNHKRDCVIIYFAFDLLFRDGMSLTDVPLIQRKAHLKRIIPKSMAERLRFTDHVIDKGLDLFAAL